MDIILFWVQPPLLANYFGRNDKVKEWTIKLIITKDQVLICIKINSKGFFVFFFRSEIEVQTFKTDNTMIMNSKCKYSAAINSEKSSDNTLKN